MRPSCTDGRDICLGKNNAQPSRAGRCVSDARTGRRSDRFLELLGSAEGDLLARLDLDRLTRGRVAAHARGALADLQNAETDEANADALLEVLCDEIDEVAEKGFRLLLRHLMVLGQRGGEVLETDG